MKDKTLIVKKKNVYGNELIYPVCQDAILFSCIAGSKTFCSITIANIKKLGYKFETQKEEIWKKYTTTQNEKTNLWAEKTDATGLLI